MPTAFLQLTQTQVVVAVAVGLLTVAGFAVAVLRAFYNFGNRLGKVEQNIMDKFDAMTKETQAIREDGKRASDKLAEHCDDEKMHVNIRLEEFRETVLNKRLDEMGAKLNLLLTKATK